MQPINLLCNKIIPCYTLGHFLLIFYCLLMKEQFPSFFYLLDAQSMPKDEDYEKGCVRGNMVYKIQWTDPPKLMPVESMCGHIPQVSILDTKEVHCYYTVLVKVVGKKISSLLWTYMYRLREGTAP